MHAALDLFSERGYDATTVTEIAERAGGLTKTTFFRHFTDKREVLFAAGQELHSRILAEAIAASPASATPLNAVASALDALNATFTEDRREFVARLRAVVNDHPELRERAAFKRLALADAMTEALRRRGTPEAEAEIAAELGVRAFHRAFERWADPANQDSMVELGRTEFDALRAAVAALA